MASCVHTAVPTINTKTREEDEEEESLQIKLQNTFFSAAACFCCFYHRILYAHTTHLTAVSRKTITADDTVTINRYLLPYHFGLKFKDRLDINMKTKRPLYFRPVWERCILRRVRSTGRYCCAVRRAQVDIIVSRDRTHSYTC